VSEDIQLPPQAYYRQGVALQCLGKHGEAIAAFANGLAQDPKSPQLLEGLVEATLKSPLKGNPSPDVSSPPPNLIISNYKGILSEVEGSVHLASLRRRLFCKSGK